MKNNLKTQKKPTKILLIEDSRVYAKKVTLVLTKRSDTLFTVDCAEKLSDGLSRLLKGSFDVVLLDLTLPDSEGLKTLDRVRAATQEIPIVILTGLEDENLGLKALKKGAQDYLVKNQVDASLLMRAVRYAIERHRVQMEHEREYRSLKRFSNVKGKEKTLPREKLTQNYAAVLKSYVSQSKNSPVDAAEKTAGVFMKEGLSGKEVIKIHLEILDQLTKSLAANDAQHVVWKARFLLLGVLANLADLYRKGVKS
jgi:DNA-binding response OmpR family regulator